MPVVKTVEVTAHRGSSARAPENTLSALRLAIEHGADHAEVDVQRARDGTLVLLHDGDLKRVARDSRRLEEFTWDELRRLDVGSWFSNAFRAERIPRLQEAIAVARGKIRLNLELKYGRPDPELVPTVLDLLRRERFLADCLITSMNRGAIEAVRRLEPRARVGLILTVPVNDLRALDVDVLSVTLDGVVPELVGLAHRAGKAVHVWTVNRPKDMQRMIKLGVDNIITDKPDVLRRHLNARPSPSPG